MCNKATLINNVPRPGDSLVGVTKECLGKSRSRSRSRSRSTTTMMIPFDKIYILEEEINSGSFGVVYKAHHSTYNTSESLAVKVQDKLDDQSEDDIIRETLLLRHLRDVPNVITLVDFYMDDERIYIIQEFAKGGDVLERLMKRETYTEHDVRTLASQLLQTMQTLHGRHQMVHRDLKPENLLLKDECDDTHILLCDFGYATFLPSSSSSDNDNDKHYLSSFVGSSPYMAPEIVIGNHYREEVDMWSVGCILYMLLSGNPPFGEEDDSFLFDRIQQNDYQFHDPCWENITANAKSLISNLLTVDQKDRYTASQALQSNWFTNNNNNNNKNTSILPQVNLQTSLTRMESLRKTKSDEHTSCASPMISLSGENTIINTTTIDANNINMEQTSSRRIQPPSENQNQNKHKKAAETKTSVTTSANTTEETHKTQRRSQKSRHERRRKVRTRGGFQNVSFHGGMISHNFLFGFCRHQL